MPPIVRWMLRLPIHIYHLKAGWMLDHRFLLLVHTGRRTGLQRETVLEVLHYDPATRGVVVMSGFGRRSDWYQNLQRHAATRIVVGGHSFTPVQRDLGDDEAVRVLAEYERRNRIATPVVRWVLSRLVGWRYDGSERARRRLVRELPLVHFSPAGAGDPEILAR